MTQKSDEEPGLALPTPGIAAQRLISIPESDVCVSALVCRYLYDVQLEIDRGLRCLDWLRV